MQSDIELAVVGLEKSFQGNIIKKMPGAYIVEDRSAAGYGLVVRSESSEDDGELNAKLQNFLKPLMPMVEIIKNHDCILRIVIFSSLLSTTVTLNTESIEMLRSFEAKLEISVYPTDDT